MSVSEQNVLSVPSLPNGDGIYNDTDVKTTKIDFSTTTKKMMMISRFFSLN
jgi:hypothetical protein